MKNQLLIGIVVGAVIGYFVFGWPVTSGRLIIPGVTPEGSES